MRTLTDDERYVLYFVVPQTACGVIMPGLFTAWGSVSDAIDTRLNPDDHTSFAHLHGNFVGIIILMLSVMPMPILRLMLDAKMTTEFQVQLVSVVLCTLGLFLGGVSMRLRSLPLLYVGCALPCGFGGLGIFQRLVFVHQLWFKRIGMANLGAGIFGGLIGLWTVVFFLLSTPILSALSVEQVLYVYAAMCPVFLFMPLFFAKDLASSRVTPASATVETKPPIGPANDVREENRKPTQPEAPADATTARPAKTELVPAWDPMLLASAASHGVAVDSNGEFDLTYGELLAHPMTWLLTIFFTTILTPGWGIKLSSVAIMRTFFQASVPCAEQITALYSAFYCVGRFVGGLVAERIGNSRTYDVMLVFMLVCLVIAPQTTTSLPHGDVASLGSQVFVGLLCIIGLMYGGCVALLYSIVFDVFGAKNYRVVLGFNLQGYAWSTLVGGVSSAYSFSSSTADVNHRPDVPGQAADQWFYAMAGATLFGLVLLRVLRPLDFNALLHRRLVRLDPSYVHADNVRPVVPGPTAAINNGVSHA